MTNLQNIPVWISVALAVWMLIGFFCLATGLKKQLKSEKYQSVFNNDLLIFGFILVLTWGMVFISIIKI